MSQIIYGIHPVEEALKSPHIQLEKILIATQKPTPTLQAILHLASQRQIPVIHTRKETLEQMARGGLHQNVVAITKEISYVDLEEVLSRWKEEPARALFLILDGIQDPQNFGSLIRTALGCGARDHHPKRQGRRNYAHCDQSLGRSHCPSADHQSDQCFEDHRNPTEIGDLGVWCFRGFKRKDL
jgi:tRNA G18 (ribose-2'-O)-methylase SpoU